MFVADCTGCLSHDTLITQSRAARLPTYCQTSVAAMAPKASVKKATKATAKGHVTKKAMAKATVNKKATAKAHVTKTAMIEQDNTQVMKKPAGNQETLQDKIRRFQMSVDKQGEKDAFDKFMTALTPAETQTTWKQFEYARQGTESYAQGSQKLQRA